ncbi:hypothetical protein RJ640_027666 [Escallonia rubra]|uniref:Cation/H+ exchanger transmembrane domain-containing protein n=1 Tax=Escallonia rubra TaxID=112253 RepID=A0AA88UHR0_9ASTE|nr:hypothetical protein RJ640_027666 [Escallonia rubra]
MKESQFFAILLVVLVSGFCAQTLGQSSGLASFMLGVSVPGGPPLGSSLVNKLDSIATGILLPTKVAMSGLSVDIFSIGRGSFGVVLEFFIILGYVGKFVGADVVPAEGEARDDVAEASLTETETAEEAVTEAVVATVE